MPEILCDLGGAWQGCAGGGDFAVRHRITMLSKGEK